MTIPRVDLDGVADAAAKREERRTAALALALVIVAVVIAFSQCGPGGTAKADDRAAVTMAHLYVAEAGWDSPRDYAAIYHAVAEGARRRGVSLEDQARAYGSIFRSEGPRAAWVLGMDEHASKPPGWPENVSWADYGRPRWLRVLAWSQRAMATAPRNPCDGQPRHWGGPRLAIDRRRAGRAVLAGRWRPLRCGGRNDYYATM